MSKNKDKDTHYYPRATHATVFAHGKAPVTTEMPAKYQALNRRLNLSDSEFFLKNPQNLEFIRDYQVGELWPHFPDDCKKILVKRFGNQRARIPLDANGDVLQPKGNGKAVTE